MSDLIFDVAITVFQALLWENFIYSNRN